MKIKFENGSSVEPIDSSSVIRGRRAKFPLICDMDNISQEVINEVIKPFIVEKEFSKDDALIYVSSARKKGTNEERN